MKDPDSMCAYIGKGLYILGGPTVVTAIACFAVPAWTPALIIGQSTVSVVAVISLLVEIRRFLKP